MTAEEVPRWEKTINNNKSCIEMNNLGRFFFATYVINNNKSCIEITKLCFSLVVKFDKQ